MPKTILVPVTGTLADAGALAVSLRVARQFDAHIDMLHVRADTLSAAGSSLIWSHETRPLAANLVETLDRVARDQEARARRTFDEFCARNGLAPVEAAPPEGACRPSAQWHVETGDDAQFVTAYGQVADIVVVCRKQRNLVTGRSALVPALLGTGRPLLIPGTESVMSGNMESVAIGWKPTPEAARAVAAAMPFLVCAKQIVIICIDEGNGAADPGRILRNLAWHGLHATSEYLKPETLSAADTLLDAARRKAGLLVMGGYGRSRLSEWAFGGFTQRALADAPLSILMSH